MYDKKKEEAERYEKQIKHLTTTRNRLDSEFDDNVSGINKKLDECANAINEGILNLSAPGRWMDELNQAPSSGNPGIAAQKTGSGGCR